MLQYIFWSSVLSGDKPAVHHGHITCTPPHDYGFPWILSLIIFGVPFIVIGIPIIAIWWDIKKRPNKPVRRVIKK